MKTSAWLAFFAALPLPLLAISGAANAGETIIAVAANFTEPAKEIAAAFTSATGRRVALSFGSSGQFQTQIRQEAPFAVLLSADAEIPARLIDDGLAVAGSRFTYAIGQLVLWSKSPNLAAGEAALTSGAFEKLAISNPKVAPYGAAAVQVLSRLGLYDRLAAKLVQGNTVAQTFQFVETGNAELGFVALSQVIAKPENHYWLVPGPLYSPLRQDAVLLKAGADDATARAFLDFLTGPEALKVIGGYGYRTSSAP